MFDVMEKGGPFMWVILFASIVGIAITAERAYVLWFRFKLNAQAFFEQVRAQLDEGQFAKAIELCDVAGEHPLPKVLKSALLKGDRADDEIQSAIEASALHAFPTITKRISYISVVANVATLLGLLGTILGLITTFEGVGQADAAMKQEILSKGISVAMLTTAGGLVAAIPNMVAFAVLQSRQNEILSSVQAYSTDLFSYLSARNRELRAQKSRKA